LISSSYFSKQPGIKMPSATVIGAVLGFGVQIYANAVRKVPLMQGPWQHAIAAGAGAAFGSWLVDFEARTEKDLQGMLIIASIHALFLKLFSKTLQSFPNL